MSGDRSAFEALFAAHEDAVGRFLVLMVRDRTSAEDLCQETFLAAWKHLERGGHVEHERAWLLGIARHRALVYLRGWRRAGEAVSRLRAHHAVLGDLQEPGDVRELLLDTLAPGERALVLLRYVHDFDGPELARLCGCSEQALRKRLSRAARKLRTAHNSDVSRMSAMTSPSQTLETL